jgi:hypothetical protein
MPFPKWFRCEIEQFFTDFWEWVSNITIWGNDIEDRLVIVEGETSGIPEMETDITDLETNISNIRNQIAFYVDGVVTTGTKKGLPQTIVVPFNCTIQEICGYIEVLPTGANVIIDANKNGTTVYTNQANRLTFGVGGGHFVTSTTPDVTSLSKNDLLTIDCDVKDSNDVASSYGIMIRVKPTL